MRVGGIILAGGKGSRFGSDIPKQFLNLCGSLILEYSIEKFSLVVDELVVVAHSDWIVETEKLAVRKHPFTAVAGGPTRQISVLKGLESIRDKGIDIVAIHDGARPLFTVSLLEKCIEHAKQAGSAVPAVRLSNTLVLSEDGIKISSYLDRNTAYQLQTPQVFGFDLIYRLHTLANSMGITDFTDDSKLFEIEGLAADIINGEESNIKITTPDDLETASFFVKRNRKWKKR